MMIERSWVQFQLGAIFDDFFFALPCVKICQIISEKRAYREKLDCQLRNDVFLSHISQTIHSRMDIPSSQSDDFVSELR